MQALDAPDDNKRSTYSCCHVCGSNGNGMDEISEKRIEERSRKRFLSGLGKLSLVT